MGLAALVRAMEVLGQAQVAMRDAPDPRVNLEVALVRLAHPEADDSPEALLARIERLETAGAGPRHPHPAAPAAPSPHSARRTDRRRCRILRRRHRSDAPAADAGRPPRGPRARRWARSAASRPPRRPAGRAAPPADPAPAAAGPRRAPAARQPRCRSSIPVPTRDQLVQAWGDHVIGRLRPKAKALFQAGRFVGVEGDRAVFGLPNEIHRTRCEEVRGEIESALAEHFGRPVGLILVVDAGVGVARRQPIRRSSPVDAAGSPPGRSDAADPGPPSRPAPPPGTLGAGAGAVRADELEDLSAFDEAELGEVADVDNSAESRVLQAFPGAEEVG